jgi:Tol biopolymer transport system component
VGIIAAALTMTGGDGDRPTPTPGVGRTPPGSVLFISEREGDFEVYLADRDGTNLRNLTNNASRDEPAAASPDGKQIAFRTDREGTYEIYVMNADGENQKRLTDGLGQNFWPTWSPDGSQIAFTRARDKTTGIYLMGADGSNVRQIVTDVPGHPGFKVVRRPTHARPGFSSDGKSILFEAVNGTNMDIFSIALGSGVATKLTTDPKSDRAASMSSDGKMIVFTSDRDGSTGIYTMRADGSNPKRIASTGGVPSFTPDGKQIVFTKNGDVWIMDADGRNQRVLIAHEGTEHAPQWVAPS